MKDSLYSGAMPFIEERGNQVVFGGDPNAGENESTWGEPDVRPVEPAEFVIDKRFWELLGKPTTLAVGFSTHEGWEKWITSPPSDNVAWQEAVVKE